MYVRYRVRFISIGKRECQISPVEATARVLNIPDCLYVLLWGDNRMPLDLVQPVDFAARGESHHAGTADRQSVSVGV